MSYIGQAMSIITFVVAYHGINKCPYLSKKQTILFGIYTKLLRIHFKWINIEKCYFYINQFLFS